ncbi:MAG: exostosin family protein [Winogradskyella arenosi]
MKIYIPQISFSTVPCKHLFILTRPFYLENTWGNKQDVKHQWRVEGDCEYTDRLELADVYFIPLPINLYSKEELNTINLNCSKHQINAYGYVAGDFGKSYGDFSNLVFFRMGGFRSQLSEQYKGFPVSLSDHYQRLYNTNRITAREQQSHPVVGFCGHAHFGILMRAKETYKSIKENVLRFLEQPTRGDYEPLFASAYQRAKLLKQLEDSPQIKTNFIYRSKYRAGAVSLKDRERTTMEYYNNIKQSDYVLCVRGAGNFSVRLYETLMIGRIPVFLNTDCLLPLEAHINWKNHVVWVEWEDRYHLSEYVYKFHNGLTNDEFKALQESNRRLWVEQLSVGGLLEQFK